MGFLKAALFLFLFINFTAAVIGCIVDARKGNKSKKRSSSDSGRGLSSSGQSLTTPSGNGCCPGARWIGLNHLAGKNVSINKMRVKCSSCGRIKKLGTCKIKIQKLKKELLNSLTVKCWGVLVLFLVSYDFLMKF